MLDRLDARWLLVAVVLSLAANVGLAVLLLLAWMNHDEAPDLPEYGKPAEYGFELIADDEFSDGFQDVPFWLYGSSEPLRPMLDDVRARLAAHGWMVGDYRPKFPTSFRAKRHNECLNYGPLETGRSSQLIGYQHREIVERVEDWDVVLYVWSDRC